MKQLRTTLALGILTLALASSYGQGTPAVPPLISVTGEAEARVDPDLATVRLGIQTQGKTAQDAQAQASTIAQRIIDGALKAGAARPDIQTGNLSLFPLFSEPKPGQTSVPAIIAYRAQNTLTIRLRDLKRVGSVVDAGVVGGANEIQGVEFGLQDDTDARRQALRDAVKRARTKAMAIAEGLGVKLGDLYDATEEGAQSISPMPMARMAMAGEARTPAEPGQVGISATVTVRFRIAQ